MKGPCLNGCESQRSRTALAFEEEVGGEEEEGAKGEGRRICPGVTKRKCTRDPSSKEATILRC